jgi:SM-20-related protein
MVAGTMTAGAGPAMSNSGERVELDSRLDPRAFARTYASAGRVHIRPFLATTSAERIYRSLAGEVPWVLHLNDGERSVSRDAAAFQTLPASDRALVFDAIHANATYRFQYVFNNFPLSDFYEQGLHRDHYLMSVLRFLNSPRFLEFARCVTGVQSIALADAQATMYAPGHFLTRHDDTAHGKKRVAAYVLNFTPTWRADWGGVLQFIDTDGHIAEGYVPAFNALNLFRVPQPHAVSLVVPFAQAGRYSITGWLRER